jgi:cytochrome c oxidase subunit 4
MAHEIDPATGHGPPLKEPPEVPAEEHAHPTFKTYLKVALILTIITVVEVWVYYTPFVESKLFVPSLLLMSAAKFAIVVMFYMHLKYDHPLFRALFTGPLIIAALTLASLLFLFGKVAVRLQGG